jgi:hypothetical protein
MTGTIDVISFPVGCSLWNIAVLIAEEIKVGYTINDLKNAFSFYAFSFYAFSFYALVFLFFNNCPEMYATL